MLVTLLVGGGGDPGVGAFPLDIELSVLGLALVVGDNQGLVVAATIFRRNDDRTIDLRGSSLGDQFGFARLFFCLEVELLVLFDLIGGEGLAILVNNLAGFGGYFHGFGVGLQGEGAIGAIGLALCVFLALKTNLDIHSG